MTELTIGQTLHTHCQAEWQRMTKRWAIDGQTTTTHHYRRKADGTPHSCNKVGSTASAQQPQQSTGSPYEQQLATSNQWQLKTNGNKQQPAATGS